MTNLVFVFSLFPSTGSPAGLHEADERSEGSRDFVLFQLVPDHG